MKHTKWSLYVFSNFMYLIQYSQIHSFGCFPYSSGKGEKYQASISYFPNWILSTNLILVILRKRKQTQWDYITDNSMQLYNMYCFSKSNFYHYVDTICRNTSVSLSNTLNIGYWEIINLSPWRAKFSTSNHTSLLFKKAGFVFSYAPTHQNQRSFWVTTLILRYNMASS